MWLFKRQCSYGQKKKSPNCVPFHTFGRWVMGISEDHIIVQEILANQQIAHTGLSCGLQQTSVMAKACPWELLYLIKLLKNPAIYDHCCMCSAPHMDVALIVGYLPLILLLFFLCRTTLICWLAVTEDIRTFVPF